MNEINEKEQITTPKPKRWRWSTTFQVAAFIIAVITVGIQAYQSHLTAEQVGQSAAAIRENTKALQQQELGSYLSEQQEIFTVTLQNSDTYVKSLYCPSTLTPSEAWRISAIFYMRLDLLYRMYKANQSEIGDEEELDDEFSLTPYYLNTPFGAAMWRRARLDYAEEFVRRIDSHLKTPVAGVVSDDVFLSGLMRDVLGGELDTGPICGSDSMQHRNPGQP